jgi:hypothetical protein
MMNVPVKMNMTMVNMTSGQNDAADSYDQEYESSNTANGNPIV